MLDTAEAPPMGHNNPPAHIAWMEHAESLTETVEGFTAISTPEQAEAVGQFAEEAGKAMRDAEKARKVAKQPHIDAGKAVDANFKPVIEKMERVKGVASALLTPWINEQRRLEREAADKARREKEAADEAARRAAAEVDQTDITAVDAVAAAEDAAKRAATEARASKSKKTTVAGVRMRTVRTGEMTDRKALLTHIAGTDPQFLTDAAAEWMRKAVHRGETDIPGVVIHEEQRAV